MQLRKHYSTKIKYQKEYKRRLLLNLAKKLWVHQISLIQATLDPSKEETQWQ